MRVVAYESKERIEFGMAAAAVKLVRTENSPLIMGGTLGLVRIIDGEEPGFHFISSWQYSQDFDASGFDKGLFIALAEYLENTAAEIRMGHLDGFLLPMTKPDIDGTA